MNINNANNTMIEMALTTELPINLDLNNTKKRLNQKYGWEAQVIDNIVNEYFKFLNLSRVYPNARLVPSQRVDEVWHDHILHTKQYIEACDVLFGKYLHHMPHETEHDSDKGYDDYQETLNLYRSVYGYDAPDDIWNVDLEGNKCNSNCRGGCNKGCKSCGNCIKS